MLDFLFVYQAQTRLLQLAFFFQHSGKPIEHSVNKTATFRCTIKLGNLNVLINSDLHRDGMELAEFRQSHENQNLVHQSQTIIIPIGDVGFHQLHIFIGMKNGLLKQLNQKLFILVLSLENWRQWGIRIETCRQLIDEFPQQVNGNLIVAIKGKVTVGVLVVK